MESKIYEDIVRELTADINPTGNIRSFAVPGTMSSYDSFSLDSETASEAVYRILDETVTDLDIALSGKINPAIVSNLCKRSVSTIAFSNGTFDDKLFNCLKRAEESIMGDQDIRYCIAVMTACGFGTTVDLSKASELFSRTTRGQEISSALDTLGYSGCAGPGYLPDVYAGAGMSLFLLNKSIENGTASVEDIISVSDRLASMGSIPFKASMASILTNIAEEFNMGYARDDIIDAFGIPSEDTDITDTIRATARNTVPFLEKSFDNPLAGEHVLNFAKSYIKSSKDAEIIAGRIARYLTIFPSLLIARSFRTA